MDINNISTPQIPEIIETENTSSENVKTTKPKSDQLAMLSFVLSLIANIIVFGIGAFFIGMLFILIGFVLITSTEYIIFCSAIGLLGTILGITSIVLGITQIKYYKAISITAIVLGSIASIVGVLDLLMFAYFFKEDFYAKTISNN